MSPETPATGSSQSSSGPSALIATGSPIAGVKGVHAALELADTAHVYDKVAPSDVPAIVANDSGSYGIEVAETTGIGHTAPEDVCGIDSSARALRGIEDREGHVSAPSDAPRIQYSPIGVIVSGTSNGAESEVLAPHNERLGKINAGLASTVVPQGSVNSLPKRGVSHCGSSKVNTLEFEGHEVPDGDLVPTSAPQNPGHVASTEVPVDSPSGSGGNENKTSIHVSHGVPPAILLSTNAPQVLIEDATKGESKCVASGDRGMSGSETVLSRAEATSSAAVRAPSSAPKRSVADMLGPQGKLCVDELDGKPELKRTRRSRQRSKAEDFFGDDDGPLPTLSIEALLATKGKGKERVVSPPAPSEAFGTNPDLDDAPVCNAVAAALFESRTEARSSLLITPCLKTAEDFIALSLALTSEDKFIPSGVDFAASPSDPTRSLDSPLPIASTSQVGMGKLLHLEDEWFDTEDELSPVIIEYDGIGYPLRTELEYLPLADVLHLLHTCESLPTQGEVPKFRVSITA